MSPNDTKPETKTRNIINGPNRYDLVLKGLLYNTMDNRIYFQFYIDGCKPGHKPYVSVSINSIEREDGDGNCFNFTGRNKYNERVVGFYDAAARTGHLEVELNANFRRQD